VLIFRTKLIWKTPHPVAFLVFPLTFLFVLFPHHAIVPQLFWVAVVFPLFTVLCSHLSVRGLALAACDHLGRLSYGIYILHVPLILWMLGAMKVVAPALPGAAPTTVGIAMIGVILGASAVLTYAFDEPLRAWLGRRMRRTPPVTLTQAQAGAS
jgi:peptidoglycan/LPS O-acetylase OafA/YrhL